MTALFPDDTPRHGAVASPALVLTALTKRFGGLTAVDNVSFSVPEGSVVGLIGPNGAGKTTTFSILAGYLKPSSGSVSVLGHAPDDAAALKGQIGVLPQDALLPAAEQVGGFLCYLARLQGFASADAKARAEEALAEVGGEAWWDQRAGSLSHGMAKRVGIAQALMGSPRLILLDEPTAGLDPRVAFEVRRLVSKRKGRATLVISSHNLQELETMCDLAMILDKGRLVAAGTIGELTGATAAVRVTLAAGPVPEDAVRAIDGVLTVTWQGTTRELVASFDPNAGDAEEFIGRILGVLLESKARISAVSKGRGLEQRVIGLTASP